MVALSMWLALVVVRVDLSKAAITAVGGATCNGVMFGLPIMQAAFGEHGLVALSVLFMTQSLIIAPVIFLLADFGQNRESNLAAIVGKTLLDTIRNPLITAIAGGVAIAAIGWEVPPIARSTIDLLGVVGPGVALFFAGTVLARVKFTSGSQLFVWGVTTLKLLVYPVLMLIGIWVVQWLSAVNGWPPIQPQVLAGLFVLSSVPMIGPFVPLAAKYGIGEPAAATMLPTTVLSTVTMFAALWLSANTALIA